MIDSHCHLADDAFVPDLEAVIARAQAAGLSAAMMILSAGDEAENARGRRVRELWPSLRVSTGIHPHQAGEHAADPAAAVAMVARALDEHQAVALGEIGLDYHYDFSPRDVQQDIFRRQIALAAARDLPIVIHTREATDDTFAILREAGSGRARGVFHCFTGDTPMARIALDAGFHISFAGIVTFPRAEELRAVALLVPEDRLLVETDAPYLAPVPNRGKRNEPALVVRTFETLAQVRGATLPDLAAAVSRNFDALFPRRSRDPQP
jgi:TatD DNase family protein